MCGITGLLTLGKVDEAIVKAMATAIDYRGPDDAGEWVDAEAGIGLGHRRLSIVDLSPAGHQPMVSRCGRYVLCYNGEIYNHAALRAELESAGDHGWRGHSDTETLLAAIARWGIEATLIRANGMFALALWDRQERTLKLARDRVGEKPLYVSWQRDCLAFGSELKALRRAPGFEGEIEPHALALLLRYNYVPGPWSILRHTYKLAPGTILSVDMNSIANRPDRPPVAGSAGKGWRCDAYWSAHAVAEAGVADRITDPHEAIRAVDEALQCAVRLQNVADVPVGAFLSGGIDSSLIVSLMQQIASHPVRTFTIGFDEAGFDEAPFARDVARHLGTDHTEFYVTASETRDVIPALSRLYDEPFADSSQLPTFLVSRLARRDVTVSLSGDAGDELFGGYNRYVHSGRLLRAFAPFPGPLRKLAGLGISSLPSSWWDNAARLPGMTGHAMLANKAGKIGRMLRNPSSLSGVYGSFIEEWHGGLPVRSHAESAIPLVSAQIAGLTDEEQMMLWDSTTYLPDDILVKVDRAAMANSLETRVPFLDEKVIALSWRIAPELKVRDGRGKWILRQLLYRHVPAALIDRPKAGFGIPVGKWLRHELRDWADSLLSEQALAASGLFEVKPITKRWREHLAGHRDWTGALWSVLMFQAWQDEWRA